MEGLESSVRSATNKEYAVLWTAAQALSEDTRLACQGGFFSTKKKPTQFALSGRNENLAATYSPILLCIVPSAMKGLTSEFGMGSGIPPSP